MLELRTPLNGVKRITLLVLTAADQHAPWSTGENSAEQCDDWSGRGLTGSIEVHHACEQATKRSKLTKGAFDDLRSWLGTMRMIA
jgi:hypothetical protein